MNWYFVPCLLLPAWQEFSGMLPAGLDTMPDVGLDAFFLQPSWLFLVFCVSAVSCLVRRYCFGLSGYCKACEPSQARQHRAASWMLVQVAIGCLTDYMVPDYLGFSQSHNYQCMALNSSEHSMPSLASFHARPYRHSICTHHHHWDHTVLISAFSDLSPVNTSWFTHPLFDYSSRTLSKLLSGLTARDLHC